MAAIIGWDVGGAHLKAARVENGRLCEVVQLPCTLWLGLEHLDRALGQARDRLGTAEAHAVTMTGELVDYFPNRAEGVRRLTDFLTERLRGLQVWAGSLAFLPPERARAEARAVASANWLASVAWTAGRLPSGLFADMGSTTTDMVPFSDGASRHRGLTDAERLGEGELIYTGAVRTPLMAVARTIPFRGRLHGVMAEYFATIADAHRLRRALPEGLDLHDTADRRGKSEEESAARLARMVGCDFCDGTMEEWRVLADAFARTQLEQLKSGAERMLSRGRVDPGAPLVGAGAGRFVLRELAACLSRPYRDFAELVDGTPEAREAAAISAPAAAVALLAWSSS
ncbi:MAG TPA: hydantoinase/oxoprolinase family protein [Alphaproteobacteria bacterium]|nr:hydantoinase/oxoprolinase family protein [Alphaproteobacteria bacterium]